MLFLARYTGLGLRNADNIVPSGPFSHTATSVQLCLGWMHSDRNLNCAFFTLNVFWTDDQKEIFMNTTLENIHTKLQLDSES